MKLVQIAAVPLLFVALAGCSTSIELTKLSAPTSAKTNLTDSRPAAERVYRRDGALDPVQFFGDEDFETPPLKHFVALLDKSLPAGAYALEVQKFRVVDIFPQRMKAGISGALGGVLGSMGYSAFFPSESMTADNITCLVSGNFQSKSISSSVSLPYKISAFAGGIKSDSSFKAAVNDCLSKLADKVSATAPKST
ncbi:MAG: hypothetical protein Tsb007_14430 [Rhizobacter sp.]